MESAGVGIDTSAQSGAVGMIDGEQVVFSEQMKIRAGGVSKYRL